MAVALAGQKPHIGPPGRFHDFRISCQMTNLLVIIMPLYLMHEVVFGLHYYGRNKTVEAAVASS